MVMPNKSHPKSVKKPPSWLRPLVISGIIAPLVSLSVSQLGHVQLSNFSIPLLPSWLITIFVLVLISLLALAGFLIIGWITTNWLVKEKNWEERWAKYAAILAIVSVILSVISIVGFICVVFFSHDALPVLVRISEPQDNTTAGYVMEVNGTSQNVPDDQKLWLLIDSRGLYYPEPGPIQRMSNGDWNGLVYLGERDVITNDTYYISAVLADRSASNGFSETFAKNEHTSSLPQGAKIYDTIAVRRVR